MKSITTKLIQIKSKCSSRTGSKNLKGCTAETKT